MLAAAGPALTGLTTLWKGRTIACEKDKDTNAATDLRAQTCLSGLALSAPLDSADPSSCQPQLCRAELR